jgi:Tol biopolymer transport system component
VTACAEPAAEARSPEQPARHGARIAFTQPGFFTSLWVMKADGSRPRPLFGPGSRTFDVEPEYSPDGTRIAFSRLREQAGGVWQAAIHVTGADGSRPRRLTPYRTFVEHPRWSPDGRTIVFTCTVRAQDQDDLCVMNADGSDVRRITDTPTVHEDGPVWS